MKHLPFAVVLWLASLTISFGQDAFDRDKLRDELLGISKRQPACLTDAGGLPRRVIITRNGAGLFETPKAEATRLRSLGLYDRLYLYVEDSGDGFHRVGVDPWGEGPTGWVPATFCLLWDNNEIVFLNGDSVPNDVNRFFVWKNEEDARQGKPETAVYEEVINRGTNKVGDLFFPVLKKDRTGTIYQIGFLFGGNQAGRDQYGKPLDEATKKQIADNVTSVNVVLVMDATGSMTAFIDEAKRQATLILDELEKENLVRELGSDKPLHLTVNFGLVAYRDKGDEFDVKTVVSPTHERGTIKRELASLEANGGGDHPELVEAAIRHVLSKLSLPQGAINRVIVIGDAPPHQLDKDILTELGREAKAKFVEIHTLACGDDKEAIAAFEILSSASGGTSQRISESKSLIGTIVTDLKRRIQGIPIEKEVVEQALQSKQSPQQTVRSLGLSEDDGRRMLKFLMARGADVATENTLRQGWIKVRPGTESRIRLFVYVPRWKLALQLSQLLNLSDGTEIKKKAENALVIVQQILQFTGGDKSGAGMSKGDVSAADRGKQIPELTPVTKKGPSAVAAESPRIREKIQTLLRYWNNAAAWEHDHIWIPVDALP